MEYYELGTSNSPPVALDPSSFPVELLLVWHNLKWAFITMVGLGEKKKTKKKKRKRRAWGGLKVYIYIYIYIDGLIEYVSHGCEEM